MTRTASSFSRPGGRRKPQPRVLVICEDSKSCVEYLEDAARHFRSYAQVRVTHCGRTDPKGIVEEAIDQVRSYDQVYCAIDRDKHESFDEALDIAANHKRVTVIDSHPCYEFWLLLHFGHTRKPYSAAGNRSSGDFLVSDLRAKPGMANYDKGQTRGLFGQLLPRLPHARSAAIAVSAQAQEDEEPNPSTRLHLLIDCFEKLGNLE